MLINSDWLIIRCWLLEFATVNIATITCWLPGECSLTHVSHYLSALPPPLSPSALCWFDVIYVAATDIRLLQYNSIIQPTVDNFDSKRTNWCTLSRTVLFSLIFVLLKGRFFISLVFWLENLLSEISCGHVTTQF